MLGLWAGTLATFRSPTRSGCILGDRVCTANAIPSIGGSKAWDYVRPRINWEGLRGWEEEAIGQTALCLIRDNWCASRIGELA